MKRVILFLLLLFPAKFIFGNNTSLEIQTTKEICLNDVGKNYYDFCGRELYLKKRLPFIELILSEQLKNILKNKIINVDLYDYILQLNFLSRNRSMKLKRMT